MKRMIAFPLLVLGLLGLAACGGGGSGDTEKVSLNLYTPPVGDGAPDPFQGVQFIELGIQGEGIGSGELTRMYHFVREGGVISVSGVPYNSKVQVVAKGYPAAADNAGLPSQYPTAVGRTGYFSVRSGDAIRDLNLFFARVNAFSPLTKSPEAVGQPGAALSLPSARVGFAATVLQNGWILVTGGATLTAGATNPLEDEGIDTLLNEAWALDPATGTFTRAQNLNLPRAYHTATLLPSGKVLISGGLSTDGHTPVSGTEIFDPFTGAFSVGTPLQFTRARHQATAVRSTDTQYLVLFTGGEGSPDTWELYDPSTGVVMSQKLHVARWNHRDAFVTKGLKGLHDAVYIVGGESNDGMVDTIEFFDAAVLQHVPPTITLDRGPKTLPTVSFNAVRNFVFVVGGFKDRSKKEPVRDVELYAIDKNVEPVGLKYIAAGTHNLDLQVARGGHTATLLPNHDLVFAGGMGVDGGNWKPIREGEVITELIKLVPQADGTQKMNITPTRTVTDNSLPVGVGLPTAALMDTGNLVILGGVTGSGGTYEASSQAVVYTYDDTPKVTQ
jgi:hypothetical protein